jgi:3-hydroxyisobutyrate dehydrogenase-like beta-hydroxyacid dehydrogenase
MQPVSIIGCGYTGRRLAERFRASGACVRGFATRVESLRLIEEVGAEALPLDLDAVMTPVDFTGHAHGTRRGAEVSRSRCGGSRQP